MALANFTADENQRSNGKLFCSKKFFEDRSNELMVLIALNIFVSVTAFLGNVLILATLHKHSSLHRPSKVLFRNLVTTDLAVGIILEPTYVAYFISVLNEQWNICRAVFIISHATGYILCAVSLLTLTAISVDRLLALLLGFRYRQVVTINRIYVLCTVVWFVTIASSTLLLWMNQAATWYGFIVSKLCLVTSVFSYTKIFFTLRHNQVKVQGQQNQNVPPNRMRYRKTVNCALWVQVALIVCYLPYAITEIVVIQRGLSPSVVVARLFTATLVLLNSSLNPILYYWKIREMRQAIKDNVKGLFCSLS